MLPLTKVNLKVFGGPVQVIANHKVCCLLHHAFSVMYPYVENVEVLAQSRERLHGTFELAGKDHGVKGRDYWDLRRKIMVEYYNCWLSLDFEWLGHGIYMSWSSHLISSTNRWGDRTFCKFCAPYVFPAFPPILQMDNFAHSKSIPFEEFKRIVVCMTGHRTEELT